MPFYTFIMNYEGGVYISQISASTKESACIEWAKNLVVSEIYDFGESSKTKLIDNMKSEEPVLLNSLTNCWCVSALIRGELALINFVQTETTTNEQPTANN